MTRWLVTGAGGMLGRDLVPVLRCLGEVTAAGRSVLDITDPAAVMAAVAGHQVVVNAAAWTDVDGAETAETVASAVNGTAVATLARACAAAGARLIQISTDYVFAGEATAPYPEDAPTGPANAYGRGKLAGERAVREILPEAGYVVRTAWLYGAHGRNFVTTVLRLAGEREQVDVIDDQYGQPTWTRALAEQVTALGAAALRGTAPPGIYHGTAAGQTTWYGLARAAFAATGLDPARIRPVSSGAFPRPAARPVYSVLAHHRWAAAGVAPQPSWRAQLTRALPQLRPLSFTTDLPPSFGSAAPSPPG
jgi:dTDP-4-dehydrorhamnose reductase